MGPIKGLVCFPSSAEDVVELHNLKEAPITVGIVSLPYENIEKVNESSKMRVKERWEVLLCFLGF